MEAGRLKARRSRHSLHGHRVELRPDGAAGGFAIVRLPGRERIGEVRYRTEEGCLSFQRMEVGPEMRGLGYGSEAVRLVEADAAQRGLAGRFRADISAGDGLALYFWLRLGYRPAAAWRRDAEQGTISMIRTAAAVGQR